VAATGAQVSRSEIVRASIAGLRELHGLAPLAARLMSLDQCRSGSALLVLAVLAPRMAMATEAPRGGVMHVTDETSEQKPENTETGAQEHEPEGFEIEPQAVV
jgi:hypothetical protein